MSDMPKPVETIGAWQMERWEYDDAPLEARRPAERYRDEMTAEIDKVGDLEIRVDTREGNVCVCVPRDVLVALLRDGVARGVLAEPSMTVAQVDAMEREYVATFLGGYHDAAQIQIFRHGMATVFNGLRASNVSPTPARAIAAPGLDLPALEWRKRTDPVGGCHDGMRAECGHLTTTGYLKAYTGGNGEWTVAISGTAPDDAEAMTTVEAIHATLRDAPGIIREQGEIERLTAEVARLTPKPVKQRGVDFPCEGCGALAGNRLDNGWLRCAKCGYPSK